MLHKPSQRGTSSLSACLLLFSLLLLCEGNYISLNVQTSSTQINQASTYSFTFNRQYDPVNFKYSASIQAVPLNTAIVITLPSQFITISTGSTLNCINAANSQALTCNVNAATKSITVVDYYSKNTTLSNGMILINVFNLINAYKAGASDNFFWQIIAPNGTVIDTGPAASNSIVMTSITFTPGTFQACSVSAAGATVSSYSPITLTITPADPIPASGQLVVIIPLSWSSDPLLTSTINASPSCTGVSNTGSSVSCSYTASPTSQVITVSSLSTSSSISTEFSISIANILIPPTVGSSETISMYSQWSDGTQIDTCSSTISSIVFVPFQSATITSNDNTTVQSSFTASLQLVISRNFYYQDSIELVLPTEFQNCQISSTTFLSFTKTANLGSLTLTNFPSVPSSIPSNNLIAFKLSSITNPLSTAPISLTVSIYRNNQLYQKSTISYSAAAGSIDSFVISPDSSFVQTTGKATFTITSSLKFPAGSTISVNYPTSITAAAVASTSLTLGTLNGLAITGATYQVTNNQIKFSSVFSAIFSGTAVLIIGTFTNPPTVQSTTYLIQVNDQNGYTVMSGSGTLVATTKALVSNAITASSYQVLQSGVTYTAAITTNFGFTAVTIIVPSDITIASGFQITCAPSSFKSCSLSGNNLTFVGTGTLPAGNYQLQWGYNTNPNSFAPTSSFQIYTYTSGYGVENSQGALSIKMTSTDPFKSGILYPSSYVNSESISITLLLALPSNAPAGQLVITVPSQVVITSATCTGCTVSSPYIYLTLPAATSNTTVVINNIKNVGSYKTVSPFLVALNSNAGYASLSSSISGWINNQPSSFNTQVTGSNNYRGESNNFKFVLTGLSATQTYAVISIDSSFGALTVAPSGFTLVNSYTLQVGCTGSSCSFNFNIVNPTLKNTFNFTMATFSADNYLVGTSAFNGWGFDCASSATDCRSCMGNGSCITCYNSSISNYYILNTFSSTCERDCNSGYFRINTTCSICDTNCSQCVSTSKTCTSCSSNYFLDTVYNLCVPACQSGYYANSLSQTCAACVQPCLTCTGSSSYCLTCVLNSYLLNNVCRSTCPVNYYIANAVTLKCDPCNSNCLTCATTTTYCLTCNNTLGLYFQNNVCVSTCSNNYFIVNNICTYCQLPCKVCSGGVTICSSCYLNSSNPVYFNQTCISAGQCPIGHYVDSANSSCELCPSSCQQCSSSTICSSCSQGYFLYGTICTNNCPNTTFSFTNSSTGVCQLCNSCATCSSSAACTSCIASQFLYNAICYAVCPDGTYAFGAICSPCLNNCPTCQNYTYCTSCVTSMNLYKGVCYLTCPAATFADTAQQICVNCPASCATCTSTSNCQTCATSYSLQNSQCVLICSKGLSFNQTCYPCGLNCDICPNTTYNCMKCVTSYYLYNNTCLSQCPSNMLSLDTINCVLCTTKFVNCSTCTFSACLTCTYGQLLSGLCVPCSPGYYAESGACTSCPSTCATCDGQTNCSTCKTNNYMLNSQCLSSCPLNMIPNGTSCTTCLANCNICNQANFLCSVCSAGYYLYNNFCYSTCPSPMVTSYDFLTCVSEAVYFEQFSKAARIVPFPFTIGTAVIIIIGVILNCHNKDMHLRTALCAVISIIEIGTWVIFLFFEYTYFSNFHLLSKYNMTCGIVGVALLVVLNFLHLKFYCKYIRDDQEFVKWVKRNSCANGSMLTVATTFNFKFYRFIHSKFLGREETSMILSSPNKLTPFSLISIISILTCSVPVFVGCALALYNSISQDQQFFIALDTITVTGIMILLILMDLRHSDDYFLDEHEAKNLKKKVYQQDQIKFQGDNNPLEDNVSHQHLMQIQEDEGDMALPPSATKFQSTFEKTNRKLADANQLAVESKVQQAGQSLQHYQVGSEENICEESEESSQIALKQKEKGKVKWQEKMYDHNGYLIKYDASNNQVKYDQNGYRVEIGEDGKHRKYNEQGHEMIMVNGQLIPHDKDGFRIINGKRYDQRGYQIRNQNGQNVAYDQNGFRVIGEGPDEKHIDENGYVVIADEKGKLRRYQEDGWEVVEVNGKKLLKNKLGQCMRLNQQGTWEAYDPQDGFTLKLNPQTGQYDKYNDLGYRVEKDQYGSLHYYDEDNYKVTILPGGEIIRHDEQGYRVEKDGQGNIHRFDADGYELAQDEKGNPIFIDKYGYRVERDLYGRTTRYDTEGNEVRIDGQTGRHRKFNEQGLQIVTDAQGNRKLLDKRGRIVKQLNGTYEKYDQQGNKIWLNEQGYEQQEDAEGKVNRYDKVGDRVDTEYEIQQFDDQDLQGNLMINTNKKFPQKYQYKATREVDQEAELDQLISHPQLIDFEEDEEISQLQEFHHTQFPPQKDVSREFDQLLDKERTELVFREDAEKGLEDLREFEHKEELFGYLVEPNADLEGLLPQSADPAQEGLSNERQQQQELDGELPMRNIDADHPNGLTSMPQNANPFLIDHELDKHAEFDQQFALRGLDGKGEPLNSQVVEGNPSLMDNELDKHAEFDKEFAIRGLDAKEPPLGNRPLLGTSALAEKGGQQGELDEEMTVQALDSKEPPLSNSPLKGTEGLVMREGTQRQLDEKMTIVPLDSREPGLSNRSLTAHRHLGERELGRQGEYDQEAYVREIDDNEPDILEIRRRDAERAEIARRKALDRHLGPSRAQEEIQIKSVADVSIGERSFENEGVQPLQNRTDFDEINSLDELEVPLARKQRGNRSDVSLVNNRKDTQTVYNYNTVAVEIKNQNPLYDEEEEIESLHEEDWQQQLNPMVFSRRVKDERNTSNANTNILYVDEPEVEDNDALTDLVQQSESKISPNPRSHRYHPMNDMLSREAESIEQIQEQLFRQARQKEREIRERREFRLSGAPNPLVQYAKTIEANKKSLQEKMYLEHTYKR